ncbi:hypothetical protein NQD34_003173 [Periophthalmus magnuspinnatus]|nr:hypothetical protein NQD34_003173 [Periophthalmus magnuspinnatus]
MSMLINRVNHGQKRTHKVSSTDTKTEAVEVKSEETKEPMDWFEPLEDDDDDEDANSFEFPTEQHAFGLQDPEEESLAGESERSGSVAGSEKGRRIYKRARRKRNYDEGWIECPSLGEGWKRKESIRQSGTRSGQSDVYYMSPQGERARSRIELSIMMNRDLSSFEFKTGVFRKNGQQHETMKPPDGKIKLPGPTSSKPLSFPSINGEFGPDDSILVCSRCGLTFTGTWYDKQRKRPLCPSCWGTSVQHLSINIDIYWWIPCGQCAGCHNKVDCGQCSNCKERSPESRKRTCRKRKCLCPIRKKGELSCKISKMCFSKGKLIILHTACVWQAFFVFHFCHVIQVVFVVKVQSRQKRNARESAKETGEKMVSNDRKRRKRRSCGECPACLYSTDCGTCDFCIDKPKFGGSNKKRQKCRLRQCQRQAMADGISIVGRAKPQYTYSRKRKRAPPSEDEDDDRNQQAVSFHYALHFQNDNLVSNQMESRSQFTNNFQKHVEVNEDDYPTITQIYSLTDETEQSDLNQEQDLMKLLNSLRSSALPILWYAIMAEGPQMQLVQCSKQSVMADTIVQIDTDFNYKISVQRHPLLPTHPLYDAHPSRLNSVTHVVNLLLDMDKYIVCHGVPPIEEVLSRTPVILERAPTCEFLIKKNETICRNCRELCE